MAFAAADEVTKYFFGSEAASTARRGVELGSAGDPNIRSIQQTSLSGAFKSEMIHRYRVGVEEGRLRTLRLIKDGLPPANN
jgi:hypothetical protein